MATNTLKSTGGSYSLMSEWQAALPATLTEPEILECYVGTTVNGGWQADGSLNDSVVVNNTANATNFITVRAADGQGHGGDPDAGFMMYTSSNYNFRPMRIDSDYTVVEGIRVNHPGRGSSIYMPTDGFQAIRNCIITQSGGTAVAYALRNEANNTTVENCVVIGGGAGYPGGSAKVQTVKNVTVINSTSSEGFRIRGGASSVQNVVAYGTVSGVDLDISGPSTDTNNASGDTSAIGTGAVTGVVEGDFVDFTNGDYTPASDGKLAGAGTSPPVLSTDITGATRNDPDDIGAYAVAGAAGINNMNVKVGAAWSQSTPHFMVSGAWQEVDAYVLVAGVWVQVHQK